MPLRAPCHTSRWAPSCTRKWNECPLARAPRLPPPASRRRSQRQLIATLRTQLRDCSLLTHTCAHLNSPELRMADWPTADVSYEPYAPFSSVPHLHVCACVCVHFAERCCKKGRRTSRLQWALTSRSMATCCERDRCACQYLLTSPWDLQTFGLRNSRLEALRRRASCILMTNEGPANASRSSQIRDILVLKSSGETARL